MKQLFQTLLVCFFPFSLAAQLLSRPEIDRDAAALHRLLTRTHPAPYAYISRDSLEHLLSEMTRFDGDSLPLREWEHRVRLVLIQVGCGHTYVAGNPRLKPAKDPAVFPLRTFTDGQNLWLLGSADTSGKAPRIPVGAQVDFLNGRRAADVVERLRRHQPSDGYNHTFGLRTVNSGLFFNYLHRKYFPADSVVDIVWHDSLGGTFTSTVRAVPVSRLSEPPVAPPDSARHILFHTRRHEQQFYFHPQHPDVGVLQIKAFHGRGSRVYRRAFREMKRRHTRALVIDVRNDLGGNFSSSVSIVRYVADERFQVVLSRPIRRTWRHQPLKTTLGRVGALFKFDVLNFSPRWVRNGHFFYRLKYRPRRHNHFDGQVLVLTNGWSFSASSLMSAYVQAKCHRATVIGEETGGGARSNNGMQIPRFVLPASHLRLRIPQYNLDYRLGPDQGKGVVPDVPVRYTPADVLADRDLEMETALKLIEASKH